MFAVVLKMADLIFVNEMLSWLISDSTDQSNGGMQSYDITF